MERRNSMSGSKRTNDIFRKRLFRELKKKSKKELKKETGINRSTLNRYVHGKIESISTSKVEALAEYFGVSPSYLMGWETDIEKDIKYSKDELAYLTVFNNKIKELNQKEQIEARAYLESIAEKYEKKESPRSEVDEWVWEFYKQLRQYSVKDVKAILKEAKEYLENLDCKEDNQE